MAEVVAAGAAGGTGVAGDARFDGDAVAGLEAGAGCGAVAEGADDAGGFVAEEDGSVDDVAA